MLGRLEFDPEERVVCFDADGTWSVEPVRSTWPHENLNGHRFGHVRTGRPGANGGVSHRGVWIVGAVVGALPETTADEERQPRRIAAVSKRHPRRFEAGSDLQRDLLLLIRSAKSRMAKNRALDLGQALAETLEDLIGLEDDPAAPVRGAVLDWDQERATADLHRKMRAKGKDPTGYRAREVLH